MSEWRSSSNNNGGRSTAMLGWFPLRSHKTLDVTNNASEEVPEIIERLEIIIAVMVVMKLFLVVVPHQI